MLRKQEKNMSKEREKIFNKVHASKRRNWSGYEKQKNRC